MEQAAEGRRGRILLADDEESFLYSTAELFRRDGFDVVPVLDGYQAAEKLKQNEFDVMISDINMPGNPNLEFVRELRENRQLPAIILVTAYPTLHTAIDSVELPIDAYLIKPVLFGDLRDVVEKCLERRRAIRAVVSNGQALENWLGDVSSLRQTLSDSGRDNVKIGLEKFVELTVNNIGRCLRDLMHVSDALGSENLERPACELLSCPTLDTLTQALEETISVLEKTKHSFKSKELGKLRKKLEALVHDLPRNVSGT